MTKFYRLVITLTVAIITQHSVFSQSLSINTDGSTADPSALLDVKSINKGILVPRMSKADRNAIAAPATGLMVFQNAPDSVGFYYYNGSSWLWLATANNSVGWLTIGNNGTDTAIHFLGTLDDKPLMLRQNNLWMGQLNTRRHSFFIGGGAGLNNNNVQNTGFGDSALFNNTTGIGNTAIGYRSMVGNGAITGNVNVAVGNNTLSNITTGGQNVVLGDNAANNLRTGNINVILGAGAMEGATKGDGNISLGLWSLRFNDSASHNIAIGTSSMYSHNKNNLNIGIGYQSLYNDTSSTGNVAVGHSALSFHHTGNMNTAIGYEALQIDSTGSLNTAVGWRALRNNKSGIENTGLGVGALEVNRYGSYNTAIGRYAGFDADTVNFTTAVGYGSLFRNKRAGITALGAYSGYANSYTSTNITQGAENTMVGYAAMTGNAFGSQNVAVGYKAGAIFEPGTFSGTAPSRNVAIGDSAYQQGRGNDVVAIGYRALSKSTTNHHQSVAVGSRALLNAISNYPNTAIGYSSQDSATTGYANTSLGSYSLTTNKQGYNNTAIGNAAMYQAENLVIPTLVFDNTAVGNDALRLARYYGNTAIGSAALRNDTAGIYNTAVGYLSMYQNLSGQLNTAVGTSALRNNRTGTGNTALGTNTLYNHKTGDYNVAIGYESMVSDTSGSLNTAMGWRSLRYVQNGYENTALGVGSLEFTDSAYANTAIGRGAMLGSFNNTSDLAYNTVMGWYAGALMDSVEWSTAIGAQAGLNNRGRENTFLGKNSGYGASGSNLTGIENTGLGAETLTFNSTGKSNTAVGLGALYGNRTGNGSVAVGTRALANGSSYSYNIAIGDSAMYGNNANENMAIGTFAMRLNNTGTPNTAVGNYALQNTNAGSFNTALGYQALQNSNANGNTALGHTAGTTITTGTFNTLLGYNADVSASTLINASALGAYAQVNQNNSMVLGSINGVNGATANTSVGIGTTTPDSTLSVADNFLVGSSGTVQYDNAVPVMNYMFKTGITNADRMVIAHSTANQTWGLQYQDATDRFNFLAGGTAVLTADLLNLRTGIGTTTPTKKLHVFSGTSGAVTNAASNILMEDNVTSYFEMSTPDASENGLLSSNTGGIRSAIIFTAAEGINFRSGGNTNRMTILSSGNVGIGTIAPAFQLELSTNSAGKPTSTLWTVSSDERLKKIDGNYTKGLADIMKLNTIMYHYSDGNARNLPSDEQGYGFSAQEVQKVFPEAVKVGKDGYLSLDLHPVFVSYINAFKELQQQLDELRKKNEKLEKDMQLIKAKSGINN